LSTASYLIEITGVVIPAPPILASRVANIDKPESFSWTVDNGAGIGGQCDNGSIETFDHANDPNTATSPDFGGNGQRFIVKNQQLVLLEKPQVSNSPAIPIFCGTQASSVQAFEFDLFQAVPLNNGVHEFIFGSQWNYATDQWQLWLPNTGVLTWVNAGVTHCQFSTGTWHHAIYILTTRDHRRIPGDSSAV
jgi:hypothetical protein